MSHLLPLEGGGLQLFNETRHDQRRGGSRGARSGDLADRVEQGCEGVIGSPRAPTDVDEGTEDSNLRVIGLEDHVDLEGVGSAIIEVLARQVEVELRKVEGLVLARNDKATALANDLDCASNVLKDGTIREVWHFDGHVRAGDSSVDAVDQVDG